MKNFNFKGNVRGKGFNINESGKDLADAINKIVGKLGLENETFGMKVTPLSTVYVPKGSFIDLVIE